jgi:hypothetical protein
MTKYWDKTLGDDSKIQRLVHEFSNSSSHSNDADSNDSESFFSSAEQSYNPEQIKQLAKQELNFLAGIAMPTVLKYFFPKILLAVWQLLINAAEKTRDFTQLALAIPRGHGKTTLIKLFILYCILFTKKRFILVISSTSTLSENIVADVIDFLNENNIKKVFGDWKLAISIDRQELKQFIFRGRPITLAAIGAGTSLRGLNIKNERPDIMIFEDCQTRECADSRVQSDALERWLIGTAMKAKSPAGCLFIFIGNLYPTPNCILRKLRDNPSWTKFTSGAILADGHALWEELQPLEQLMKELDNDIAMGHPEIFFAEVLNDTEAGVNNRVDLQKISEWRYTERDEPQGNFILIDPAGGKGRDDVSLGYFEVYDGTPALVELDEGDYSPGITIKRAIMLALRHNCRLIGVESNSYQATLCYWFTQVCNEHHIVGIEAVEIHSGLFSKNSRIAEALKQINAGELLVHPTCKSRVVYQAAHWNPMKRDNVDGILDLLAYAQKMMNLFGHMMTLEAVIENQLHATHGIVPEEANCPF